MPSVIAAGARVLAWGVAGLAVLGVGVWGTLALYLYRTRGPLGNARRLFLEYVRAINELHTRPRFYDTLTTNCTTAIVFHTRVNPGHLPFSWKVLLSGYAAEHAHDNGRLDTSLPFEELRRRSRLNAAAVAADRAPDFSRRIREGLPGVRGPMAPRS